VPAAAELPTAAAPIAALTATAFLLTESSSQVLALTLSVVAEVTTTMGRMPPAPPPSPRRLGVVLAAGAGRRFGGPKILAADGAWLRGAIAALAVGGCDAVAVCMGAAKVPPPDGVIAVPVPDWSEGMSASTRAALDLALDLEVDQVMLHLVDLPDVGPEVVARVAGRAGAGTAALARAAYNGHVGHPVLLGRDHFAAMRATLTGDAGGRAYLAATPELLLVECGDLAGGRDIDCMPESSDGHLAQRPGV